MVAPAFGFSVGDFIAGTKLLITLLSAFKERGGASTKYASESSFLTSLVSTLQHLDNYVKNITQDDISRDITKLLKTMEGPLDEFKLFLDKYEASLGQTSTKTALGKTKAMITYTVKDISGKVEKLRRQVEQPLEAVNSLLSLQVIKSIEKLPEQPLQQDQLAQIIEAIRIADIPTELDKQIQVLQRSTAEHNIKQDEQLQRIKDLRAKLDGEIAKLHAAVEEAKDAVTASQATTVTSQQSNAESQLDASKGMQTSVNHLYAALESRTDKLETAMKEQRRLILALSRFLEEKAAMQERALAAEDNFDEEEEEVKDEKASWPPATLSAAHLAFALLSTVVSSVVATSVARRNQYDQQAVSANVEGSASNNGTTLFSAYQTKDTVTPNSTVETTRRTSSQSAQLRGSTWASNFSGKIDTRQSSGSRRSSYIQPKKENRDRDSSSVDFGGMGAWTGSSDTHWSKKLSKLDESDPDKPNKGGEKHDTDGGSYMNGPGPVIPSSGSGGFGHSSGGATSGGGGHSSTYNDGYSGDYSSGNSGGFSGGDSSIVPTVYPGYGAPTYDGVDPEVVKLAVRLEISPEEAKARIMELAVRLGISFEKAKARIMELVVRLGISLKEAKARILTEALVTGGGQRCDGVDVVPIITVLGLDQGCL